MPNAVQNIRRFSNIALLLVAAAPGQLLSQDSRSPLEELFPRQKTDLEEPNVPVAVDLFGSPTPELVVTDVRGRIAIFDGETGKLLRETSDAVGGSLTGPVVGNFVEGPRLEIAVGTRDGRLLLFDGTSLEVLIDQKISQSNINVVPTVATLPDRHDAGKKVDVILLVDEQGWLYACYATGDAFSEYWKPVPTGSRSLNPPTVGHVRGRDTIDIVVPTSTGYLVLVNAETGDKRPYLIEEQKAISTAVLLADFSGDGLDDMVFTMKDGRMHVVSWDGEGELKLKNVAQPINLQGNEPVTDPVLVGPMDQGPRSGLIFQGTVANLWAVNPQGWSAIPGSQPEFGYISTQISVLPSERGFPALAIGVGKSLRLVDTNPWFVSPGSVAGIATPSMSLNEELRNTIAVIAVRRNDVRNYGLLGLTGGGGVIGLLTDRQALSSTDSPWMTRGGTPGHSGVYDAKYHAAQAERAAELRRTLDQKTAEMNEAMDAGEWERAFAAARWRTLFDPLDEQFKKDLRNVWIRKNLLLLVAGGLAAFATIAALAWLIARMAWLRALENKGRAAVASGNFAAAEPLYEKLLAKKPRSARVQATLAMVYVSTQNDAQKTIAVYKAALAQEPEKQILLQAYAAALLAAERTDAEARGIYERALGGFPEPARMEYAIGACHKATGELGEAGKRLRAALRGGFEDDRVYAALCDVYLATSGFGAKSLPVFQNQFQKRQQDQKFLEGYLLCCIDARQMDSEVESLCHMVLEANRAFVPAYCHLASIYLQKGQTGSAIEEVKRAVELDPQNEPAIRLLAQCYMTEGRTDDTAQVAFQRASNAGGDNAEVLRALAGIYWRENRYDADAVAVYRRALEANPNDATTLKALAQAAALSANHELAVRTIESLVHQGQAEPQHTVQLAKAYFATGCFEPRTEKTWRDAVRIAPEDAALRHGHARTAMLQGKSDAESIAIYEAHLRHAPGDREVGAQLARAYQKNHRYQDSLELCQRLLKSHPDDPDLKSLVALSSLYSNKIDEAVAEYTQILARNPNDAQAQVHLALACAQKGRTDEESTRLYQAALKIDGKNPDLYLAMGRVHLSKGDSVKAVECYEQVPKVKPGSEDLLIRHINAILVEYPDAIRVRWFLSETLVAHGHLRDAMEQLNIVYETSPNQGRNILGALDRILVKDSKNVQALGARGRILASLGELEGARESLEKAYKLQPSNADIGRVLEKVYEGILKKKEDAETRFRLGRLQYMGQEYDKAIGNFQKTAQDYRWEGESVKMLGKCFTAKGMLDLALQEFKKLVVDEETKELLYDLAQRYEGKKDLVGAKTVYRQLFAADIDYKDVKTRFEMLSGSTSDPVAFDRTNIVQAMSEEAKRRYELLDELGRGAMGIVYRAKDRELDEVVALKILPDSMSNNPEAVRRFKIEARNARRLSHPHIVRIHDIGEEMGRKYISMEYVDGSDLKKKVREGGKFTMEEFFRYASQISEALAYAHRLGIVHRDIKPANIMLTKRDDVKVTDFGIAKMLDQAGLGDAEGTMVGAVIGTPLYMSPEQVQGIPVDNRADIYAFGVMLYEFVNGRPPFTEGDLAYQHVNRQPDPPKDCPEEVWQIIKRCLEKDKDARWANAEAIVDTLREVKQALGIG